MSDENQLPFVIGDPAANIERDNTTYPFTKVLFTEEMSDAFFFIERQKIPIHTTLLRLQSPVFLEMFSEKWTKNKPIEVKGYEADDMRSLLRWMYCRELVFKSESLLHVLMLADKYAVQSLVDYLVKHLDPHFWDRVFTILTFAAATSNVGLLSLCTEYIIQSASLEVGHDFNRCSKEAITHLLVTDKTSMNDSHRVRLEMNLFKQCIKLAEAECDEQKIVKTAVNKRKAIESIILLFSFPDWDIRSFVDIVCPTRLLSAAEENTVLKSHFDVSCQTPFHRTERKIIHRVPVRSLKKGSRSKIVNVRGMKWCIETNFKDEAIGVYLSCIEGSGSYKRKCKAICTFVLIQHEPSKSNYARKFSIPYHFTEGVRKFLKNGEESFQSWGWKNLVTFAEVQNPANGWLKDGHIIMEASFTISEPEIIDD